MSTSKLKVAVLTQGDASRLVARLREIPTVQVTGVMLETDTIPHRKAAERLRRSIRYDGYAATLRKLFRRAGSPHEIAAIEKRNWSSLEEFMQRAETPLYKVKDLHAATSIDILKGLEPDLGILYGTNIIRESVFAVPRLGSINLHQGRAPYYRGGPTVFWELFNGESEIGITIHFVAKLVDTGDIVLQRTLPLTYDLESYGTDFEHFLSDFRPTLSEPSVEMLAEAVRLISEGREQRVRQDTTLGKRYRLPTKREKDALRRRLKRRIKAARVSLEGLAGAVSDS